MRIPSRGGSDGIAKLRQNRKFPSFALRHTLSLHILFFAATISDYISWPTPENSYLTQCIRILQLGDLHVPDWKSSTNDVDQKDVEFSSEIIADLKHDRIRHILRRVHEIASSGDIDCIALMGDFTTFGMSEYVSPAVEIIDGLVSKGDGTKPLIVGVPGNHDVDRENAALLGKHGKFKTLSDAFEKFGWAQLPTDATVRKDISFENGRSIGVLLLNSSIGSWSKHFLPRSLADDFASEKMLETPVALNAKSSNVDSEPAVTRDSAKAPKNREEQLFQQLDTPYISKRSMESLSSHLNQINDRTSVVIAHHNLLSQRIPRISPYGEMLNGGAFRDFLHTTKKNIIYLHGHIHEDPIECISVPSEVFSQQQTGQILSISAPLFQDGFNEISLFLGDDNEVFMVRVTKYRPNQMHLVGNFSDQETVHIPLINKFNDLITGNARKVWQLIKESQLLNWSELISKTETLNISTSDLEHIVLKLFCCRVVEVSQLGRSSKKWVIQCVEVANG